MKEKPLVIYHANCWDGFCAAWVMRKQLGDIEALPAHHGSQPPSNISGRYVYVVDFSYPRDTLVEMSQSAEAVCVLDHHKTAKADLEGLWFCHFADDKSGSRMAWEYWHDDDPAPWLVDYTEDRDLWRHALPDSEYVNAALRSYPLDFDLWDQFEHESLSRFVLEGSAIRRAERAIVSLHTRNAREVEMDGHRILAVNATVLFSEIAGELAASRPFGACYFDRKDGKRQWSLRSREGGIDVSEIAKAHGGGGHQQAAGFEESYSPLAGA